MYKLINIVLSQRYIVIMSQNTSAKNSERLNTLLKIIFGCNYWGFGVLGFGEPKT